MDKTNKIDPREHIRVEKEEIRRPYKQSTKRPKGNKSMSSLSQQHNNELPSTYFVQDRHNKQELKRLIIQDQMITSSMGGVLPEQTDPTLFRHVLDVGCGTGGWLIEVAKAYPSMPLLVGIDISNTMVTFACTQAAEQRINDRADFHIMDALRQLEFPDATFDLVNLRFGSSYARTWEWPKVISEMLRICRPGGIIRLTEPALIQQSNSPSLLLFCTLLQSALFRAGHLFEEAPTGITAHLAHLLMRYGAKAVQTKDYALEYRAGTEEGQAFLEDTMSAFQTLRPFIQRWVRLPKDYDAICQHAITEMKQPDFQATWNLLTAWGTV